MKKIFLTLLGVLVLSLLGYFIYINYFANQEPKIKTEEELVSVSEYYIYGNHMNIKGSLTIEDRNYESISLILYNNKEKNIEINASNDGSVINFNISELINDGLYLDDLERGTLYLFLKITYPNENPEEEPIAKYYALKNETDYEETEYYTLSKYNNIIKINSDNDYSTMALNITENKSKNEIADITLDPGHGGMDGGGSANGYKETDFTIDIATKVKTKLEALGLKVKLTHKEGDLSSNEVLDEYNTHGRAVVSNEVKSKYTFSIHINKNVSSRVHGLEIYTADNINYDLAQSLAQNLTLYTGLDYSVNKTNKIYDGVYTRNFTESDISSSLKGYEEKGYKPYNVTTNSNYFYMIRETGGFMTGAYIDDSNPERVGVNPYYNSNVGNETYLMELGYLSNTNDLEKLLTNEDKYVDAIVDAIKDELSL